MGIITSSAIFSYNNLNEENEKRELNPKAYHPLPKKYDPYEIYTTDLNYGVYADGELVYKCKLKREALATITEWEEMDAELGEKHKYKVEKLVKDKKGKKKVKDTD